MFATFSCSKGIQPTLLANIYNIRNTKNSLTVRILLDPGSNISFVLRSVARKLSLSGQDSIVTLNVASGQRVVTKEKQVQFRLGPIDNAFIHKEKFVATTLKKVGNSLPKILFDPVSFDHLKQLRFSEKFPSLTERNIDVLLGEPYALRLLGELIKGKIFEPSAVLTPFGPALCGAEVEVGQADVLLVDDQGRFVVDEVAPPFVKDDEKTIEIWQKMYDLSNIGISVADNADDKVKEADLEAVERMRKVSIYDAERQKWSTKLLFKDISTESRCLPDGYGKSKAIMLATERKIPHDQQQLVNEAYGEFLVNGLAEVVPAELEGRSDHPTYILPSRPVLRLTHEKTKCRIIINASARSSHTDLTLNKLLLTGPNLLPNVPAVILRFRHRKFIFTLDIQKHFLQVELRDDEDRDMLRYLWRNFNQRERPTMFRHKVLAFGLVSSPFQAIWCVQETARMFGEEFPLAKQILHEDLYMDDIISGADTPEQANKMCREVVACLKRGGFTAHQGRSNDIGVLAGLPPDTICLKDETKVLGHLWHTQKDYMKFDLEDKFPDQLVLENISVVTR